MCVLSQCVASFSVRTGAWLSAACMQGLWGDIPPVDSELHLDSPGWQQSGLFKHVKAEEPLRESNKACLRAKGRFVRISREFCACLRNKSSPEGTICNTSFGSFILWT